MSTGSLTDEKANDLVSLWAVWVDGRHPNLELLRRAGLEVKKAVARKGEDLDQTVDLGDLADDKEEEGASSSSGTLKPGEHVTVCRRFTWAIPLENNADYRHDVPRGAKGVVQGFADEHHRQVLVAIDMRLPSARGTVLRKVIDKVYPRNLQKTSDYEAATLANAPPEPEGTETAPEPQGKKPSKVSKLPKNLQFLAGGEETKGDIIVEAKWESLVDHSELLHSFWALKGKVAVLAAALLEQVPPVTSKDLAIVHRPLGNGEHRTEVWTLRKFAAKELLVPVVSLEVRDCLWTNKLYSFLGLPAAGAGAHPEGKKVAFDGRGKARISSQGAIDEEERKGLLCWIIERTKEAKFANLDFDSVTADIGVNLAVPGAGGKRRRVTHKWTSELLPSLPVLVNPKALAAHTRLFVPAGPAPTQARAPRGASEAGA